MFNKYQAIIIFARVLFPNFNISCYKRAIASNSNQSVASSLGRQITVSFNDIDNKNYRNPNPPQL